MSHSWYCTGLWYSVFFPNFCTCIETDFSLWHFFWGCGPKAVGLQLLCLVRNCQGMPKKTTMVSDLCHNLPLSFPYCLLPPVGERRGGKKGGWVGWGTLAEGVGWDCHSQPPPPSCPLSVRALKEPRMQGRGGSNIGKLPPPIFR